MAEKLSNYTVNTFNQELLQCVAISFFIRRLKATEEDFFNYIGIEMENGDDILKGINAEYNVNTNLKVFNTTSDTGISWVKSSISIARFLIQKLNLNSNYTVYHQKSKFGRLIKDECIKRMIEDLDLKKFSDEPDVYNPTDIWIAKDTKVGEIENRLKEKIIDAPVGMVTKNYLSNRHTYKSIIATFFRTKDLYQISLKNLLIVC